MVKESNQYWQLQKQEIPSLYPTAISLGSGMTTTQDINGITLGTGTTGDTLDGTTQNSTGDGTIGFFLLILISFLGARWLDRKLNRNLDRELRDLDNQNQE